jgi:hypothetical protein
LEAPVNAGTTLLLVLLALSPILVLPFVAAWASATGRLDRWGHKLGAWGRRHPVLLVGVLPVLYLVLAVLTAMDGKLWLAGLFALTGVVWGVTNYLRLVEFRAAGSKDPPEV